MALPFLTFPVHGGTITFGIFLPKELQCTIDFEKYDGLFAFMLIIYELIPNASLVKYA
jgi:hypothetical protein